MPGILVPGAYNQAVKNIGYAIYVASLLVNAEFADTDLDETIITPAVRGTTNMLEAALNSPSVKLVVITSSVSANSILTKVAELETPNTREAIPPYTELWTAYRSAKHGALLASDAFMSANQPHFDLVNIMPASVLGRKEFARSAADVRKGSNGIALTYVFDGPLPFSMPSAVIHLDDVSHVHVAALRLSWKVNRGFGMSMDFDPNEVPRIIKKHFPEALEAGIFKQPEKSQEFHYM